MNLEVDARAANTGAGYQGSPWWDKKASLCTIHCGKINDRELGAKPGSLLFSRLHSSDRRDISDGAHGGRKWVSEGSASKHPETGAVGICAVRVFNFPSRRVVPAEFNPKMLSERLGRVSFCRNKRKRWHSINDSVSRLCRDVHFD